MQRIQRFGRILSYCVALTALLALMSLLAPTAQAATVIIGRTSFEEPASIGSIYTDTGSAAVDHALPNNVGQPILNYTSVGGELGFSSFYFNTRNDVGLTDGDIAGVTSSLAIVGSYPDGAKGFRISDADGKMTVTLDPVNLTAVSSPMVSLQYYLSPTTWETAPADILRIWVVVDGGVELNLLNTAGSDIDNLNIEGSWLTLQQSLTGYTTATLKFELDSNADDEAVWLDNILFQGVTAVELNAFTAVADGNGEVTVDWETAVEIDHAGFNLYRSQSPVGNWARVNDALIASQGVNGLGSHYQVIDSVTPGIWYYSLEDVDLYGHTTAHGPLRVEATAPTAVALTGFGGAQTGALGFWGGLVLLSVGWLIRPRRRP